MPVCGSGVLVCSSCLLIRRAQRARCQAETPPILLSRFPEPALTTSGCGTSAWATSIGSCEMDTSEILRPFVKDMRHLTSQLNNIASDMIRDKALAKKLDD